MGIKEVIDEAIPYEQDADLIHFTRWLKNESDLTVSEANTKVRLTTINYKSENAGPGLRT